MWVKKHKDARNEALDLKVGNLAMVELLNPDFEAVMEDNEAKGERLKAKREEKKAVPVVTVKKTGFVNRWKS